MLSCKEVVKLISGENNPKWTQRLELRMHLFACHHCGRYAKQLEQLASSWRSFFQSDANQVDSESIKRIESAVLKKIP